MKKFHRLRSSEAESLRENSLRGDITQIQEVRGKPAPKPRTEKLVTDRDLTPLLICVIWITNLQNLVALAKFS
jgi:hypothetical protein